MDSRAFSIEENPLSFKQLSHSNFDGVDLSKDESLYLLPHFLMLLIGKPASGKTTLLRQLLTNPQMYSEKFNEILLVSPSYAKMDLNVRAESATTRFSLDWIFDKLEVINEDQQQKMFGHSFGGRRLANDKRSATGATQLTNTALMGDQRSRFYMADHLRKMNLTDKAAFSSASSKGMLGSMVKQQEQKQAYYDDPEMQD